MYCISLWQPWATLWALGLKQWETRHWKYPNWLKDQTILIHAASKWDEEIKSALEIPAFYTALTNNQYPVGTKNKNYNGITLPIGALIGTVKLTDCIATEKADPSPLEATFGNYAQGRFAWIGLEHQTIEPIILPGKQNFFWYGNKFSLFPES